jgi:hypothetical protein
MSTVADVVRNAFREFYAETTNDPNAEHARIFADDLFGRVFRWRRVEDVAELTGKRDYLPELNPPYRDPIQERVRTVVASATRWWWSNDLAEMRADAAGRAVADMIDSWAVHYATEAAKLGPRPKAAMPSEVEAAYDAERRYQERRGR